MGLKSLLKKITLCSLVIASCLTGEVGCTGGYRRQIIASNSIIKQPSQTSQKKDKKPARLELYVNQSTPHYIMERSQEDGEEDLKKLSQQAKVEESWIYVKYKNEEKWYEDGLKGTEENVKIDPSVMQKILPKEKDIKEISLYHFHIDNQSQTVISEFPSSSDINYYSTIHRIFHENYSSLAKKIDFRIITKTGKYVINPDESLSEIDMLGWGIDCVEALNDELTLIKAGKSKLNYSKKNQKNFGEVNTEFAQKFSNPYFRITFTRH